MSAILSTPRIFGLVLIGLMITSCGGRTSSNTSNGGGGNNNGGVSPNNTLTVSVPSLGVSQTVTRNTTLAEINSTRANLEAQCRARYPISRNTQQNDQNLNCLREVETAYNQAVNFIGSGPNGSSQQAELEWEQYRRDCQSFGPLSPITFSDGSRGRCVAGSQRRADGSSIPVAFRDR